MKPDFIMDIQKAINAGRGFGIEFWTPSAAIDCIVYKKFVDKNNYGTVRIDTNGNLLFHIRSDGINLINEAWSLLNILNKKMQHIAITVNDNIYDLYCDGVKLHGG